MSAYKDALEAAAKAIPMNWLDSLLTGPNAVIKDLDSLQIEALLRGIQDRIRALPVPEQEPVAWMQEGQPEFYAKDYRDEKAGYVIPLYAAPVATGMVLVPVEPTEVMVDAAERLDWADSDVRGNVINQWNVMLAAAKESK